MLHKQWCFMVVCDDHWWLIDGLYWWWSVYQPLPTWNKQPQKNPGAMVRPLSQPSEVESRNVHINGVPRNLRHQGTSTPKSSQPLASYLAALPTGLIDLWTIIADITINQHSPMDVITIAKKSQTLSTILNHFNYCQWSTIPKHYQHLSTILNQYLTIIQHRLTIPKRYQPF